MNKIMALIFILLCSLSASAQDVLMGDKVSIRAEDGLMLAGDLYHPRAMTERAPAVLLLHMLGSERSAYDPLIPILVDAGYVVINIDMRGHGQTGGSQNWDMAVADIQTWFAWVREQEEVQADAVSIIGASIGSNLALIGCAQDTSCLTAIALSPGWDYRGVAPEDAVLNGLSARSALLIASHGDGYSAETVREFFSNATGNIGARLFTGRAHGTSLFDNSLDSVSAEIVSWLDEHVATQAN